MKNLFTLLVLVATLCACQKEDSYTNPELDNTLALIESQDGEIDDVALVADLESATIILGKRYRYEDGVPVKNYIVGGINLRGIKLNEGVMWSNYVSDSDWTEVWGSETKYEYDIKTRVFTYPEFEGKSAKVLYYDGSTIIIDGHLGALCYDNKNVTHLYVGSISKEMPDGWVPFPVE